MEMNLVKGRLTESVIGTQNIRKLREGPDINATPAEELERYVKMTPAERMQESMLEKLGLTKEELEKKSPDEQKAIREKIADMIKEALEKAPEKARPGSFVDTTA